MFNTPPPDAQTPAPEGQTENWQERFKGLQKAYNKLQTEHEAATARANDAENALKSANAQLVEATKSHQSEVNTLKGQMTQFEAQVAELSKTNSTLQADLGKFQTKESARQAVINAKAADLLPFVDAGNLSVAGLEGDALTAELTKFRNLIAEVAGKQVNQEMAGSSPALSGASPEASKFKGAEDMFDWLMNPANETKPEWGTVRAQYLKATNN